MVSMTPSDLKSIYSDQYNYISCLSHMRVNDDDVVNLSI